ncbi:MAG: hypothetical protein O9264_05985 [Leptospira sp.]|nr:hypothetical protein [Leptospira sp.]
MNTKLFKLISSLSLVALFIAGCTPKKKDDNTALLAILASQSSESIPPLLTIVQEALPTTLKDTSYTTSTRSTSTVQDRFFKPGPSNFRDRLSKVDSRVTELRSSIPASCLIPAANNYTALNTAPSGNASFSFPMTLTCRRDISSSLRVYFGRDTTHIYLAEIQNSTSNEPPTIAVLAKINIARNDLEVHQISRDTSGTFSWVQIKANSVTRTFEISNGSDLTASSGSNANYTGVGCGVQMKTSSSLAYASGQFGQSASCPAASTSCSNATGSTFTDATGSCTGSLTTFSTLVLNQTNVGASTIKTMLGGIFSFTGFPTGTTF